MKYCSYCGCSSPNHVVKCIGCYRKLVADKAVFITAVAAFAVVYFL